MANVKITDLTALSGGDAVDADVFVVVDISADQTKKITKTELQTAIAAGGSGFNANDFVTFTQLNSNINVIHYKSSLNKINTTLYSLLMYNIF